VRRLFNGPVQAGTTVLAVLIAWFAMQAIHECGHVIAAWITGGTVKRVVLHPFAISRTDVSPNPHPLIVAWSGPLVGVAVPLVLLGASKFIRTRYAKFFRFFAGFCLIANGAYIGAGSFYGIGDAGDLLRHGAPHGTLVAFGFASVTAGLWIWHRMEARPD
jgi:Peptidase M50B-like